MSAISATEVRKNWGGFIDSVVRGRPEFVKRNRDFIAVLSIPHLETVLSAYRFHLVYDQEADGSISGSLQEIDVVANAPSVSELKQALAHELLEYAREYMEHYDLYSHAPNRKGHLPYVLRVLIQPDEAAVAALIDA
ncbi:MAG TPA: hypothetical protein VIL07_03855 [Symbiobacteriaceae bacterium]